MPVKGPGGNRSGLGGVSYGELYGTAVNLAVTAATPATIINLTNGDTFSTTLTGASGTITTDIAEPVAVDISISFSTTAVNSVVIGSLVKGVTPQTDIAFQRTISSASTIGVITMSGIINLAAGDILTISVTSDKNATLTFEEINFRVTGLGAVLAPVIQLLDYLKLSGRSGGQIAYGGTASGDDLELHSTAHATKGSILLGSNSAYDEVNDRLGIGTLTPEKLLHLLRSGSATLRMSESIGSSYFDLDFNESAGSNSAAGLTLSAVAGQNAIIDLNPMPVDNVSDALFRFFRQTNTSGTVSLAIHFGDGTSGTNHVLSGNDDSYVSKNNGNFGVGVAAASEKLHVVGDIRATATYTSTTASAANMFVDSTGKYFRSTSSARYKRNIRALGFDPKVIFDLQPKSFNSIADNDATFFGLVAEEVHEICPELVGYKAIYDQEPEAILDEDGNPTGNFDLGNKIGEEPDWVMYDRLPVLMLPIITELKDKVKSQKDLINDLIKRVTALEGN